MLKDIALSRLNFKPSPRIVSGRTKIFGSSSSLAVPIQLLGFGPCAAGLLAFFFALKFLFSDCEVGSSGKAI